MTDLVSVDEANGHLRLDLETDGGSPVAYTDERLPDLQLKITLASGIVVDYLKTADTGWDAETVPAPVKVAVLPLSKKEELIGPSREVFDLLAPHYQCDYDETQAIGRRYRRQDEIGTPYGVTIDHQSLEDSTVTLRDRDTLEQERVKIDDLPALLAERLERPWTSPKLR